MGEVFSSDEVERIVRRAIELDGPHDVDAGYSLDAIVRAADEVGVPRRALLESAAIERLGNAPEAQLLDPVVGAAVVVTQRTVAVDVADALRLLDDWLTVSHHLRREQIDDRSGVWRKRSDVAASVQRHTKSLVGGARLGDVRRIDAVVSPVDDGASIVRLLADRRAGRAAGITIGSGVGAGSAVVAGVTTSALAPAAVIVVPGLAAAGAAAAMTRRGATKLERELVRLLDRVAAGEPPPRLTVGVARRLGLRTGRTS